MHIAGMTIGGIPPFTEPVEFEFHKRVNVFVGPNATGKTTLLRAIGRPHFEGRISSWEPVSSLMKKGDTDIRYGPSKRLNVQSLPVIYVASARFGVWLRNETTTTLDSFGAYSPSIDDADAHPDRFDSSVLYWKIVQISHAIETDQSEGITLDDILVKAFECASEICAESFPPMMSSGLAQPEEWFFADDSNISQSDDGVQIAITTDQRISQLSQGMKGTLLWLLSVALDMAAGQVFEANWEKQPAILLIDEIENHLHPTWQRRVIPALLEHFPGLQIFATTHSPFVVAGLKAGQVHLLNRDENGVVTATTNTEDIVGWTADEILRTYDGRA